MPLVTNEAVYEILKAIQARVIDLDGKVDELRQEAQAVNAEMVVMEREISAARAKLKSAPSL